MMALRKTVCALTVLMLVMSCMTMVAISAPAPPTGEASTDVAPVDDVITLPAPSTDINPLGDDTVSLPPVREPSMLEGLPNVNLDTWARLPIGKDGKGTLIRGETDSRAPTTKILLVDDDDSSNVGTEEKWNNSGPYGMDTGFIIDEALTDAGFTHDSYVVEAFQNGPDFQMMTNYSTIIWAFGYEWGYGPTLTRADYWRLQSFMDAGGSVWFIGNALVSSLYGLVNYTKTGQNRFAADDFALKYLGIEEYFPWSGIPGIANTTSNAIMDGTEQYATQRFFDEFDDPPQLFSDVTRPVAGGLKVLIGDSHGAWGRDFNDEPVAIAYDSGTWRVATFSLDLTCIASGTDRADIATKVMGWLTRGGAQSVDFAQKLPLHSVFNWYVEVEDQAPLWTSDWDFGFWSQYYNPITATIHTKENFTAIAHFENQGRTNERNFDVRFVVRDAANRELANFTKTGSVDSRLTGEVSMTFKPVRAGFYVVLSNITLTGDPKTGDNAAGSLIQAPTWVDDIENGTTVWNKSGAWAVVNAVADSNTPTHAWQLKRNNYQTTGDALETPLIDLRFYNTSFSHPAAPGFNMIWYNFFFKGRMYGTGQDSVDVQMKASNDTNWHSLFKVDGNTQVGTGIANGDFTGGWYRFNSGIYLGDYAGQTLHIRFYFVKGAQLSQSWWSVDDNRVWMQEEMNIAPWFMAKTPLGPNYEMDVGSSQVFDLTIQDPNGDSPLTIKWLENFNERTDWAGRTSVTLNVPKDAPVGDKYHRGSTLNIAVQAGDGLDLNDTFWNVKLMDPRPRASAEFTGLIDINEDAPKDVNMAPWFVDIEGQSFTVTSAGSANIKSTTVTGTILNLTNKLPNWNGEENITLKVTDSASSIANFTLRVRVLPVNDAPKVKVVQLPDGLQDEPYSSNLTATDVDNVVSELSWSDDSPLFQITNSGEIAFRPDNADVGYHTFNVTASDPDQATHTVELTLFVANVNDPPELRYIPPQSADEDSVWTFDVSAYVEDPDLELPAEFRDRITYRDDTPKLDTNLETGIVTWDMPTNEDVGDFYFKITVQDSKGRYAEQEIKIGVNNTNDEPKLGSIQRQTLHQDAQYVYTVPATDDDTAVPSANEELTFTNDRTELFTIDAVGGRISFTPVNNQVGVWEINITVTDIEGASATKKVVFEVVNKNDAPELDVKRTHILTEDQPFEFQVVATDPDMELRLVDGQRVDPSEELEFRTNSTKVPIDRDTGMISFTPTQAEVGEFAVKITVIDSASEAETADVLFKVTNVNDPPAELRIVGILEGQQLTQGKAYQLIGSATDVDNGVDQLTYQWYENALIVGQTATVQWKPKSTGLVTVKLVVSDPDSGQTMYNMTVNVKKKADEPGFGAFAAFAAFVIASSMVAAAWRRRKL